MLLPREAGGLLLCLSLTVIKAVSASLTVENCPDHIDCARVGRHFCIPGSSQCGPCIDGLEEDDEGNCINLKKQHYRHGKDRSLPDLDEEIDYLSSVIAKQQLMDVKTPASPSWSTVQLQSEAGKGQSVLKGASHSTTAKPNTHSPSTATQPTSKHPKPRTDSPGRGKPIAIPFPRDSLLVILMSVCIITGIVALILAAACWVRLQKESHLAQKVDYPAFKAPGTTASNISSGDKNLAHSAQMYHYQHQKQQMLSMEKHKAEPKLSEPGATSEEETEEGDFTVYECPGLAPTGEMEVKNPLFDDSTLHRERNHK
ncbi:neural proliferation differentiation and control protein 1a [Hoplias malabaricus]|uniref:neural proliferation differentiation and control protein 1a n=1 Tax=Hoplias malabaricus TaxID=27720 RepID=UPI0034618263